MLPDDGAGESGWKVEQRNSEERGSACVGFVYVSNEYLFKLLDDLFMAGRSPHPHR